MSTINFTYTILKYRPDDLFLQVKYEREGRPAVLRNFQPPTVTQENMATVIHEFCVAQAPIRVWTTQDAVADIIADEILGTPTGGVYTPPPPPEPPTPEEELEQRIAEVEQYAQSVAEDGIQWTDADGATWLFRTDIAKQGRFAIMETKALAGTRLDTDRISCKRVRNNGNLIRKYRRTTNAEVIEIAAAIDAHIQKCLEAEANTVEKMEAGDMTADFDTEFAAL